MANQVLLKQKQTGELKRVAVGFSWTILFFGGLVPLFRKDWGGFFLLLFVSLVIFGLALVFPPFLIVGIITAFYFAFKYNKLYIKKLLSQGYAPENELAEQILLNNGILFVKNNK